MTLRSLFWRAWIAGTLGLLIIVGVDAGSTTVAYNDLSTETIKLEAEINKSVPGSATHSQASRRLAKVKRDMDAAEQDLIRDALWAFLPPLVVLIFAFFVSLLFRSDEDAASPEEAPTTN